MPYAQLSVGMYATAATTAEKAKHTEMVQITHTASRVDICLP
jgi:hypothetical protein